MVGTPAVRNILHSSYPRFARHHRPPPPSNQYRPLDAVTKVSSSLPSCAFQVRPVGDEAGGRGNDSHHLAVGRSRVVCADLVEPAPARHPR